MTPAEIRERMTQRRAEELERNEFGLWWLSFADDTKPNGFLGVIILEAYGFTDAIAKTHDMRLNPGGQVRGDTVDPDGLPKALYNRLLKKSDLAGFGVSTKGDAS